MMTENIIKKIKNRFGYPILDVEITDEMFENLFEESQLAFSLFSKLGEERDLVSIREYWVIQYFNALAKECLGNIRGKFSGKLKLPGIDSKLDYVHLLKEAECEKVALIKTLYPNYQYENTEELVIISFYVNVGNMDKQEVEKTMSELIIKFTDSMPSYVKPVIIPIRNKESYVEVIYSNIPNDSTSKLKQITDTLKDLDSEVDKYFNQEDEKK